MPKVNAKLPLDMVDAKDLSLEENFDLGRDNFCDLQLYRSAPTPPSGDDIENLQGMRRHGVPSMPPFCDHYLCNKTIGIETILKVRVK